MESIRTRWCELVIGLLLAAVTLAAYWPARNFDFVDYDDQDYVKDNAFVRSGLNKTSVAWAFKQSHSGNWHPLTWVSLMFDCQFFGEKKNPTDKLFNIKAGPMHVHNALLHTANAALLFWVLRRMTGAVWASAFAAALFAWHPLRVESVAWVTERKDVLSTLFWLLTMWAWLRFTERRNAWRYGVALVMFALGLMSKSMLVTLPCVLVLLDFWPLKRWPASALSPPPPPPPPPKSKKKNSPALAPAPMVVAEAPAGVSWKWLVLEKIPFFALIAAVSAWTLHTQRSGGAMTFGDSLPMKHRLLNGLVAYVEYLRKFFWPDDLAVFYPHPGQWPAARIAVAATILVLVTVLAVWQRRTRPHLLLGWLWYLGTLVPVLGIIQVGGQAWADRYTYVPMLGIVVALAWELAVWIQRWRIPSGVTSALAAVTLIACLAATAAQLKHWQNTFALFSHALDVTKNNHRANKGVADVYRDEGKNVEANRHYEEAIRIKPTFLGARVNYGMALVNQKKFDAAAFQFRVAVQINPNNPEAHNNLAAVLEMTGKHPEAIQEYRKAIELRPNYPTAQKNLDKLLARQPKGAGSKP